MSEQQPEIAEDAETEQEREYNAIPDEDSGNEPNEDDPQTGDGDGDGEQPGFVAPEPPVEGAMSERQIEANHKKLDRARTTFYNRVSEIMGEDAQQLVECPACSHFIPGLIFPLEFADDQKLALWRYMGLPDPNEIADAPDRHVCETCKGRGQVKSGSLVPEYAIVNCRSCLGRGYIDDLLPVDAPNGANGTNGAVIDGVAPPMPEDPAWIEAARAAGYTVVPPYIPQGT